MNPRDAQTVLFVRAVESIDTGDSLLDDGVKSRANSLAGAPLPADAPPSRREKYLVARAGQLIDELARRSEQVQHWSEDRKRVSGRVWGAFLFLVLATVTGFLTNELGAEKRINILAFPLLGILAWSLLIYVSELIYLLRWRGHKGVHPWAEALRQFVRRGRRKWEPESGDEEELARAIRSHESSWSPIELTLLTARLKTTLHLAAALFAAGAIGGMYVKGLANEYRATWESTFFSEGSELRPFLEGVLGPAAALRGEEIPGPAELDRIQWTGDDPAVVGENAARWIHWYAITIGLAVIGPRLLLALLWRLYLARLSHTIPYRRVDPHYFDRLIALASGKKQESVVVPYGIRLDDETRRRVRETLEELHRRSLELEWRPALPFGEEDSAAEALAGAESGMLLFDFGATPEKETHRLAVEAVRAAGAASESPTVVLLDPTRFDRIIEGLPDRVARREERLHAWEALLEGTGAEWHLVEERKATGTPA